MTTGLEPASRGATGEAGPFLPLRELPPLPVQWQSLPRAFIRQARALGPRTAMADSTGTSLTYGQTLLRALVLGRVLEREWGPADHFGLMVPPTVPAAVANLAVSLRGKIPVNLNYSASQALVDSSIEQCGITHVLTSSKVLDRFKITPKGKLILLEEIPGKVRLTDKLWAAAVARLVPVALLPGFVPGLKNESLDATATVIFTSGSTADPKGVVLSHRNILSNVHQVEEQVHLKPEDVLLGILPFFHAFGFTITIWAGVCLGKKIVYHFNPLDAKTVGKLCEQHAVTLLVGTPSFMRLYLKSCEAKQFRTITHLLLGAEKLKPELARDIRSALEIDPVEGYGCTELSPVVAVNVPNEVDDAGRTQDQRKPLGDGRTALARDRPENRGSRHRRRPSSGCGRDDRRQRAAGDGRLLESSRGHRPGQEGRLVPHRRPGLHRPRRVPQDHGPAQPVLKSRRRDGAAPRYRDGRSWR